MMENQKSKIKNSKSSLRDASRLVDLVRRAGRAFGLFGDI
jgi:hypothetical protein